MKFSTIFLAVMLLHEAAFSEMRVWHKKDGSEVVGEYVRHLFGNAYLRDPNSKTCSLVIKEANLCDEDLRYIQLKIPPEIEIKLKVKKTEEKGEYADPYTTLIHAKVTLAKVSTKPFAGVLVAEIYLVRKEISSDEYRILAKKQVDVRFSEDAKRSVFEVELSSMARELRVYDEPRGWTYEGYLVVVREPKGEVLRYKTDLGWLDEEMFDVFRKLPTYWFFDKNCRRKSTPRPTGWYSRQFD